MVGLGLLLAVAILAGSFFYLVSRMIMRRLGGEPAELASAARRMAQGDLTVEIPVERGGEASLAAAFGTMRVELGRLIGEHQDRSRSGRHGGQSPCGCGGHRNRRDDASE